MLRLRTGRILSEGRSKIRYCRNSPGRTERLWVFCSFDMNKRVRILWLYLSKVPGDQQRWLL